MTPILREILGDRAYCHAAPQMPEELGPQFRLDHDNVHWKPPAALDDPDYQDRGGGLHGGFMSHHVTCVYELVDVEPGTGGFVSIRDTPAILSPSRQHILSLPPGMLPWNAPSRRQPQA